MRWLVAKGFAEHARETSVAGESHRAFQPSAGFSLTKTTCLVLTPSGAAFAAQVATEVTDAAICPPMPQSIDTASLQDSLPPDVHPAPLAAIATNGAIPTSGIPRWDVTQHELWLDDTIVKRFRVPAHNQTIILDVFEEEGWPACIDDPLPPSGDIDPPTRLHDAINRLNGNQVNALLRFRNNGHGSGVSWELRQPQPHKDDAAE